MLHATEDAKWEHFESLVLVLQHTCSLAVDLFGYVKEFKIEVGQSIRQIKLRKVIFHQTLKVRFKIHFPY